MNRYLWVDNAKAIAIFLVVLGHFAALDSQVKTLIYTFHLPVFLFVTGFLVSKKLQSLSLAACFKLYIVPYVRLYLGLALISILIWCGFNFVQHGIWVDVFSSITATLYGVHGEQRWFLHPNGPLWYFPLLISSLFVFYGVLKLPKLLALACVLSYLIFSCQYQGGRLPWCFDVAGIAVFFMYLGAMFKRHYATFERYLLPSFVKKSASLNSVKVNWVQISLWLVLAAVWMYLALSNGRTNLNTRELGQSDLIYLCTAFLGTWLTLVIANLIPSNKVMHFLAKHTLIIFSVHIYFVKYCRSVDFPDGVAGLAGVAFTALLIVGICSFLARFLNAPINRYLLAK